MKPLLGMALPLTARYTSFVPMRHSAIVFENLPWWQLVQSAAGAWKFAPTPEGTHFRSTFRYDLRLGKIGDRIDAWCFQKRMENETVQSLANLKRILEAARSREGCTHRPACTASSATFWASRL
jgi:hypothetical protein